MVEKENKKLETENESLRVAKRHMIGIPSSQARPKRNAKAALALVEELDEQYVGIGLHIESLFSAWAVKEVAELQHFIKEPRRQWTLRGDDVNDCGIEVAGGKLVAPVPPHSIARKGTFYQCSTGTDEYAIKSIMEEELKGEQWNAINSTEEGRREAIKAVCSNSVLRMSLKRCLSDTASYKKRVARDCLFNSLKYDKLISKNAMKDEGTLQEKASQINEAKHKLMKHVPGTTMYDMSWWRRCQDDRRLTCGNWDEIASEGSAQYVPGIGAQPSEDSHGDNEAVEEEEETYGLFRNEAAKNVWEQFMAMSEPRTSTEDEEGGGGEEEVPESSILQLARMDAWIMTVLECLEANEKRGGKRQKQYMDTFQKFLPIAMGQLSEALYHWVDEWEPADLEMPLSEFDVDTVPSPAEAKDKVFSKTYRACIPVYVPTANCAYLSIRSEWFTKYVGKELGKVYDCYIGEFSTDYSELKKLSAPISEPHSNAGAASRAALRNENFADSLEDVPPLAPEVCPPLPISGAGADVESGIEPAN